MMQRISDLVNHEDPQGRTFCEINENTPHNIPIGQLVEIIDTGERLKILRHTRDCDGTPLYTLALSGYEERVYFPGYQESSLKVIKS